MRKKIENCIHCSLYILDMSPSEKANHTRWCSENPNRTKSLDFLNTSAAIIKRSQKIKQRWKDGNYSNANHAGFLGRNHTDKTKQTLKDKALNSSHRRLKKNVIMYKGVMLDSSWEFELAKRLDSLNIDWIRPDPITWVDTDNNSHHYFPDFYLPKYDIYLDPKNPHAIRVQKKKLDILLQQYLNIVILKTLVECKTFIPTNIYGPGG